MFKMYLQLVLLLLEYRIFQVNGDFCTTPDNKIGKCVPLRSCPELSQKLSNKTTASVEFLRQSICDYNSVDAMVCCSSLPPPSKTHGQENNRNLLPDKSYCGLQHSDEFLHDVNKTSIVEFPWLARLLYKNNKRPGRPAHVSCTGSLISARYVLTAGSCIQFSSATLYEIQLGEYHIRNETDCVVETGIQECSDTVKRYSIERVKVHPNFNRTTSENDIALIRLNNSVTYTDYIRPICLPYHEFSILNVTNTLVIGDWDDLKIDPIKRKIPTEIISEKDCAKAFEMIVNWNSADDNRFCTRAVPKVRGLKMCWIMDLGAPVMYSRRLQWYLEGITVYSTSEITSDDRCIDVQSHLKTERYLKWIEENIEP